MNYHYQPYDGHRELFAINDVEVRYVCVDCSKEWSPPIEIDDSPYNETYNPQVPDSVILLLGVELL